MLKICQDITPLSGYAVIEQCEWKAIEVTEAMLVWMVTVVSSLFTVHTQVPLTCRDTERKRETDVALDTRDRNICQLFSLLNCFISTSYTCLGNITFILGQFSYRVGLDCIYRDQYGIQQLPFYNTHK